MIKCRKSILSELTTPIFVFLIFIFTPLNFHAFSITSLLHFLNDYQRVFSLALYFFLRFLTRSTVDFQFSVFNFLSFIVSILLRSFPVLLFSPVFVSSAIGRSFFLSPVFQFCPNQSVTTFPATSNTLFYLFRCLNVKGTCWGTLSTFSPLNLSFFYLYPIILVVASLVSLEEFFSFSLSSTLHSVPCPILSTSLLLSSFKNQGVTSSPVRTSCSYSLVSVFRLCLLPSPISLFSCSCSKSESQLRESLLRLLAYPVFVPIDQGHHFTNSILQSTSSQVCTYLYSTQFFFLPLIFSNVFHHYPLLFRVYIFPCFMKTQEPLLIVIFNVIIISIIRLVFTFTKCSPRTFW